MRRVAVAAAAVVAGLALSVAGAPVAAQTEDPSGTLRLASQTSWLRPDGEFVLRLQVAGVPDPADVEVRISVHRRLTSRSQFALTLRGESLGGALRTTTAKLAELLPTDPGGAIQYRLRPADLRLTATGVHPVQVVLRDRRGVVLDRLVTHLVLVPATVDGPRLGVSVVLPVHARTGPRALEPIATLTDVLQSPSYAPLPLVLAPTPETLERLDREVLEALRTVARGHQVVAQPWVPVDVAALLASGLDEELVAQRRRGVEAMAASLGRDVDTDTWLATEPLDDASVDRLRDFQVSRLVVPDEHLAPIRLQVTLAQPFKLGVGPARPMDAVVADGGLAAHFVNRGDQVLAAHQLLADLAVLWLDAPQRERAVVVVPGRTWSPNRAFLDAALQGLVQSPVHQVVSLDDVFGDVEPARGARNALLVRELAPDPDPSALGVSAAAVQGVRDRIEALSSALPVDSDAFDALDGMLLTALSADFSPRQRREHVERVDASIRARLDEVEVPRSRTLTLTAREGEIPLTFRNDSDETMTVDVRLVSDRLEFPAGSSRTLELPPRSTTLRIPVRARTSGSFPLTVSVVTPENGLVLASTRFTVRSTAASGVGVGLSIGAGVFLLFWWGRHLLRGRRARKLVPA